jgi:hypothetical protein
VRSGARARHPCLRMCQILQANCPAGQAPRSDPPPRHRRTERHEALRQPYLPSSVSRIAATPRYRHSRRRWMSRAVQRAVSMPRSEASPGFRHARPQQHPGADGTAVSMSPPGQVSPYRCLRQSRPPVADHPNDLACPAAAAPPRPRRIHPHPETPGWPIWLVSRREVSPNPPWWRQQRQCPRRQVVWLPPFVPWPPRPAMEAAKPVSRQPARPPVCRYAAAMTNRVARPAAMEKGRRPRSSGVEPHRPLPRRSADPRPVSCHAAVPCGGLRQSGR